MRVRVELRVRRRHAAHPRERTETAAVSARRRDPAGHERQRVRAVDRRVRGVEQPRDVEARRGRRERTPLVGLVPDRPFADEGVPPRRRVGEVGERRRIRRCHVRRTAPVRPRRRAVQRDQGLDATRVQSLQDRVHAAPPVRGVVRRERARGLRRRHLVPVDAEADRRHAQALDEIEPMLERAGPVQQPRVVLNPVLDPARRGRGERAQCRDGGEQGADRNGAQHERPRLSIARKGGVSATPRLPALDPRRRADRRVPDVENEGEQRTGEFEKPLDPGHA